MLVQKKTRRLIIRSICKSTGKGNGTTACRDRQRILGIEDTIEHIDVNENVKFKNFLN